MRRLKLQLEYDGAAYSGWQLQVGQRTVQGHLEASVQNLTGETVRVHGAGRTDTGVHASMQVAHFDSQSSLAPSKLQAGLNHFLRGDCVIRGVWDVDPAFHARFKAMRREYTMVLWDRGPRPPWLRGRVTVLNRPIEAEQLASYFAPLIGTYDFQPLALQEPPERRTVRELMATTVRREGSLVTVGIAADGFLRKQIRLMVGTAIDLAKQQAPADTLLRLVRGDDVTVRKRGLAGHGLYLSRVVYPEAFNAHVTPDPAAIPGGPAFR